MTRDKGEQMKTGVVRYMMVMIASLAVSSVTLAMVRSFGDILIGWRVTGLIYTAIFVIMVIIVLRFVDEHDDFSAEAENGGEIPQEETKPGLITNLKLLAKNKFFVVYVLICILYNTIMTINNAVGAYYVKYVVGNEDLLGLFTLSAISIIAGILVPVSLRRYRSGHFEE